MYTIVLCSNELYICTYLQLSGSGLSALGDLRASTGLLQSCAARWARATLQLWYELHNFKSLQRDKAVV